MSLPPALAGGPPPKSAVTVNAPVTATSPPPSTAAEIDGALEVAGHEHVPAAVHGDAVADVVVRAPETLRPEGRPVRPRELRVEDVPGARTGRRSRAEVRGAREVAGNGDVPIGV